MRSRSVIAMLGLLLLVACGGSTSGSPGGGSAATLPPSNAPASAPASTVQGAAFDGGYPYTISRVSPFVAQTTIKVNGQTFDATVGNAYYLTTVVLKNPTSQQEPGFTPATFSGKLQHVVVAVSANDAPALIGRTYTSSPPATMAGRSGPGCTSQTMSMSGNPIVAVFEAFVTSAGNYCLLDTSIILAADPPGDGFHPPELAPGATQNLSIYYGPATKLPAPDLQLFATDQDSGGGGFRVPGPGTTYATYSHP